MFVCMETFFYKKKKLKLTHNFFLQKTTKKTSFTQYANLQNKFSVRSSKTKATSVKKISRQIASWYFFKKKTKICCWWISHLLLMLLLIMLLIIIFSLLTLVVVVFIILAAAACILFWFLRRWVLEIVLRGNCRVVICCWYDFIAFRLLLIF